MIKSMIFKVLIKKFKIKKKLVNFDIVILIYYSRINFLNCRIEIVDLKEVIRD